MRSVTLKHCFRGEETQKNTMVNPCSFKEKKRNYMRSKICLKQLLNDTLTVKRYGK